jgi:hypothetical protein
MFLRQLLIVSFLISSIVQSNGCPSKRPVKANQPAGSPTTPPVPLNNDAKAGKEKMDLLIQKVLNKEPSSANLAREIGEAAAPRLKPLAVHEDPDVRMIALGALVQSGGEGLEDVFINALSDESPTASVEGVRGLQPRLSSAIYAKLLEAYDKVEDPARRQDIALMLGRIPDSNPADLRQRREKEGDLFAKEGLITALAKLGDKQAQADFMNMLGSVKGRDVPRFLEHVQYIGKDWAMAGTARILGDKSPVVRIAADDDIPGESPEYLRACDLVVNMVAKTDGPRFSFGVSGKKNYSDAELREVRDYLSTLH